MIEVNHLTKQYGDKLAVNDISFTVEDGEILGLLGPNGAGKSTTMNMLTGYISSTSGQALINGIDILEDPIKAKAHIGYLPELPPLYLDMTVMGKYLAALTLYTIGLAIIFVYALILSFFGAVAWGIVISNILALFLLGAAFIAVTLFISSLTENQVVAAVVGMIVLLALALIDVVARYAESVPVVPTVLNALSFYTRYYDFTAGLFDPASVLFYVSTAVIFNFFTVRVFEKRRWS